MQAPRILGLVLVSVAVCVMAAVSPGRAAAQSKRHLVYNFTVGITNASSEASSFLGQGGVGAATNGTNNYNANSSDKGQITVDILGMRPDGGLVVEAGESAKDRREGATTCIIYPSTNVTCGAPNTNPEIIAILRTLSPNFYDESDLHWQVDNSAAGLTIDFTATPERGGLTAITSQRDQTFKGAISGSIHATAKYEYNPEKYVPVSLQEYSIVRQQQGPGAYTNVTIDITAQLASDSAGS